MTAGAPLQGGTATGDRALRAAESGTLVIATVTAPDAASAVTQLIATMTPEERDVGRTRLAASLRAISAQRLVSREASDGGRYALVEWVDPVPAMRESIVAGGDIAGVRKAIAQAARDGRAELFPAAR